MKPSARVLVLAGLAYYAVMILVYLGREVEGGGLGKAVRLGAVAYLFGMLALYLDREVLSSVQVLADDQPPPEQTGEEPRTSR